MQPNLPTLTVGAPRCHEGLSVFPLFSNASSNVEYRLAEDAFADNSLSVREVSEAGVVANLLVENVGKSRILFLEGDLLIGAKQNRIVNTSVLIAGESETTIPVSCIEQGRWGYRSRGFAPHGRHSPSSMRRILRESVARCARTQRGHRSDQAAIWRHILHLESMHGTPKNTHSLSEILDDHEQCFEKFQLQLPYVEQAVGVAMLFQQQIVSVDIFDKPATCQRAWERLLSGCVADAVLAGPSDPCMEIAVVERLLASTQKLDWQSVDVVGEGQEFRAETESGQHGCILEIDSVVLHGSLL